MSDIAPHSSDLTQQLNQVLEYYFSEHYREKCYIGLVFQQGKRKMVQINVPAHDLPTLLQAKPSTGNDPDSGKNRPEVQGHTEEVKEYILKRIKQDKPWILGTLTANVDPERVKLIDLARGLCLVVIGRGVKLDITDGQHRKRAIHELITSSEGELIGDNDFPITLVLEGDFRQCQIDFKDMAQTKSLDKSLLLSFGEFEGRVGITKNLIHQVSMFADKTEAIKDHPSLKKKLVYTFNYIAKLVSLTFDNDINSDLADINVEESSDALIKCLNQFFSECSQTRLLAENGTDKLTVDQLTQFQVSCILGRSVGLEILGYLLYNIYDENDNSFDIGKISLLAELDWSTGSDLWNGNIVKVDPNPKKPANPYRISASMNMVKLAVWNVKNKLRWIETPASFTLDLQ
jgi:DNA sulfur modification protein DndB